MIAERYPMTRLLHACALAALTLVAVLSLDARVAGTRAYNDNEGARVRAVLDQAGTLRVDLTVIVGNPCHSPGNAYFGTPGNREKTRAPGTVSVTFEYTSSNRPCQTVMSPLTWPTLIVRDAPHAETVSVYVVRTGEQRRERILTAPISQKP